MDHKKLLGKIVQTPRGRFEVLAYNEHGVVVITGKYPGILATQAYLWAEIREI